MPEKPFSQKQPFLTTGFNVNTTHPLISNSDEYIIYRKYVNIHSEDRDMLKYPSSNSFEIELPEDITNVGAIKLVTWAFPFDIKTFTSLHSNITMTFQINNPYNPNIHSVVDPLIIAIYNCLISLNNQNFTINIEEGNYTVSQMTKELTNKFNAVVTAAISDYLSVNDPNYPLLLNQFIASGGYNRFQIVVNSVSNQIWFGNISDGFILTNEVQTLNNSLNSNICRDNKLPVYTDYGLPGFLGLSRTNMESVTSTNYLDARFYYGDVVQTGDNGIWLLPDPSLTGSQVYWVEGICQVNIIGNNQYIYMELEKQNCVDETSPFNVSQFTATTNETNGICNAYFAKIPISIILNLEISSGIYSYKMYWPPAERIRRLKFKFRLHNGQLVNFECFNFSFVLEFSTFLPQQLRNYKSLNIDSGGVSYTKQYI